MDKDKSIKSLCKGVSNGDCVIISGKIPKNPDLVPEEFILYLTGIQCPRCINPSKITNEDAYAWECRDFLRKKIAGKVISYKVDYKQNDKVVGQIFFEGTNMGIELVKNGLGKVGFLPKANENIHKTDYWQKLEEAQENAKKNKLGLWSEDSSKHKRKVSQITDESFDLSLIKDAITNKTELDCIIEYVFNCSFLSIYLPKLQVFAKLNLRFVAIPNSKDVILSKGGKAYVERLALHQDVKLKIFHIDEQKNLIGDIICSKGDLAGQVLKEGYSKLFTNSTIPFNQDDFRAAQSFMNEAKQNRLRVWKNEPITEKKVTKVSSGVNLPNVKCLSVNSGDSITVVDPNYKQTRIFLSNIKCPNMAKAGTTEQDQPWAFQAKEFLRNLIVGKKIICDYNYGKTITKENAPELHMNFYTVYFIDEKTNNQICVNTLLLEKGFAKVATFKIDEGENSSELDNFRNAEEKAKQQKVGLYSNKNPPVANYSDLMSANKEKKRGFTSFLVGIKGVKCVIEYCFNSFRYKVRIDEKKCEIPFALMSVKGFAKDKNNDSLHDKYYLEGFNYVNDVYLQRNFTCDIISADKVGNYFGHLYYEGKNISLDIVRRGLGVIYEQGRDVNIYLSELKKEEEYAMKNKQGIWSNEGLANILKGGEANTTGLSKKYNECNKDIKLRVTEFIDFHNFYINIMPNKTLDTIEKVLEDYNKKPSKRIPLELPIKKGTLCAAKYPEDDKYYRALVKRHTKDNKFEVEFIDYGNVETLLLTDLIKLDGSISSYEPQSVFCEFAYLKYSQNSMKKLVNKFSDFNDIENILNGKICYEYDCDGFAKKGLVVYEKGTKLEDSYHNSFLKIGYARMDPNKKSPEFLEQLGKIERKAEKEELGIWAEGEELDYGEEAEED